MSLISKIGKKGRIRNGKYAGFFVRIDDDSQNTGGYLILTWQDVPSVGYAGDSPLSYSGASFPRPLRPRYGDTGG
jgi:hypothetical protein